MVHVCGEPRNIWKEKQNKTSSGIQVSGSKEARMALTVIWDWRGTVPRHSDIFAVLRRRAKVRVVRPHMLSALI